MTDHSVPRRPSRRAWDFEDRKETNRTTLRGFFAFAAVSCGAMSWIIVCLLMGSGQSPTASGQAVRQENVPNAALLAGILALDAMCLAGVVRLGFLRPQHHERGWTVDRLLKPAPLPIADCLECGDPLLPGEVVCPCCEADMRMALRIKAPPLAESRLAMWCLGMLAPPAATIAFFCGYVAGASLPGNPFEPSEYAVPCGLITSLVPVAMLLLHGIRIWNEDQLDRSETPIDEVIFDEPITATDNAANDSRWPEVKDTSDSAGGADSGKVGNSG